MTGSLFRVCRSPRPTVPIEWVWTWFLAIASGGRISWEKCNQPIRTSLDTFIFRSFSPMPSVPSRGGGQRSGSCRLGLRSRKWRGTENAGLARIPAQLPGAPDGDYVSRPDEKPTQTLALSWNASDRIGLACVDLRGLHAGDGLNRQAISGAVTCDGHPLSTGAILFEPATDGSGTAVGSTIRHGSFAVPRHDGPVPGRYRVRIYASSGTQAPPTEGHSDRTPRPMVELLPETYNTRTELVAEVIVRRANHFRFDLRSRH